MKRLACLTVLLMAIVSQSIGAIAMRSPTANVLNRLVWLGDQDGRSQGSGTLISHSGTDYLVTAHHLYRDCNGNPSVRFRGRWNPVQWEVVAKDESLDMIVLKSPQLPGDLAGLPVLYGVPKGTIHGQIGYSLGFPGMHGSGNRLKTDHILEMNGRPIPIATLVVANLSPESKLHYSASYINAGFSGGAIVYYVAEQERWTIAGVIAGFPHVFRPVYDRKGQDTGQLVKQHTGLVAYAPMAAVIKMIDDASSE